MSCQKEMAWSGANLSRGCGLLARRRDSLHLRHQGRHYAAVVAGESGTMCVCGVGVSVGVGVGVDEILAQLL